MFNLIRVKRVLSSLTAILFFLMSTLPSLAKDNCYPFVYDSSSFEQAGAASYANGYQRFVDDELQATRRVNSETIAFAAMAGFAGGVALIPAFGLMTPFLTGTLVYLLAKCIIKVPSIPNRRNMASLQSNPCYEPIHIESPNTPNELTRDSLRKSNIKRALYRELVRTLARKKIDTVKASDLLKQYEM